MSEERKRWVQKGKELAELQNILTNKIAEYITNHIDIAQRLQIESDKRLQVERETKGEKLQREIDLKREVAIAQLQSRRY